MQSFNQERDQWFFCLPWGELVILMSHLNCSSVTCHCVPWHRQRAHWFLWSRGVLPSLGQEVAHPAEHVQVTPSLWSCSFLGFSGRVVDATTLPFTKFKFSLSSSLVDLAQWLWLIPPCYSHYHCPHQAHQPLNSPPCWSSYFWSILHAP